MDPNVASDQMLAFATDRIKIYGPETRSLGGSLRPLSTLFAANELVSHATTSFHVIGHAQPILDTNSPSQQTSQWLIRPFFQHLRKAFPNEP